MDNAENSVRLASKYFDKNLELKEYKKKTFFKSKNLRMIRLTKKTFPIHRL